MLSEAEEVKKKKHYLRNSKEILKTVVERLQVENTGFSSRFDPSTHNTTHNSV